MFDHRREHLGAKSAGHAVKAFESGFVKSAQVLAQAPVPGDTFKAENLATRLVGAETVNVTKSAVAVGQAVDQAQNHLGIRGSPFADFETQRGVEKLGKTKVRGRLGKEYTAAGRGDFVVGKVNLDLFCYNTHQGTSWVKGLIGFGPLHYNRRLPFLFS